MNPRNLNAMESLYMSQKLMLGGDSCIEHTKDVNRMLEIHKKTKMQMSNGADKMVSQKGKDGSEVQQISFAKPKGGARKPKEVVSIEDLTCMLRALCIYDENDKSKNALVPYRGNNAIIPFEPIKK